MATMYALKDYGTDYIAATGGCYSVIEAVAMFDSILPCQPDELGLRIVKTPELCDVGLTMWDTQWLERRLEDRYPQSWHAACIR